MHRLLLGSIACSLVAAPAAAYTSFNCAAARMGGLMPGDTIKDYYARLFDQCGCALESKIPLCKWLKTQKDTANVNKLDKEIDR